VLETWHALAKLCIHATSSLAIFNCVTKTLGQLLRCFNDHVYPKYNSQETPGELRKQAHHAASKAAKNKSQQNSKDAEQVALKRWAFNLAAYKPHALCHYPSWICHFGTADSYSTQMVFIFSPHH